MPRNCNPNCCPRATLPKPAFDLCARSSAARTIGGDFYDFFRYTRKAICAEAIGDVSGKGASAAIHAALVTGMLRSLAAQELGPADMLRALNKALLKRPLRGRFVSLVYATWDERDRLFRIANAGLPYPLCVRNGKAFSIKAGGMPLGLFEDAQYEEQTLACDPGDLVVFYTDGVTEAVDLRDRDFGQERLEKVVCRHSRETADGVVAAVFAAVASHWRACRPPTIKL